MLKNLPANMGDTGSIPGLGRSPGEGNGNPLQYSCLENSMDGGTWWATVLGVAKSQTRPSDFTFTFHMVCEVESDWRLDIRPHLHHPGDGGDVTSGTGSVWGFTMVTVAM